VGKHRDTQRGLRACGEAPGLGEFVVEAEEAAAAPRNSQDLWIGVSRDLLITTL
jgi:hypothetical protein